MANRRRGVSCTSLCTPAHHISCMSAHMPLDQLPVLRTSGVLWQCATIRRTSGCNDAILALGTIALGSRAGAPVLSHGNQLAAALGSMLLPSASVERSNYPHCIQQRSWPRYRSFHVVSTWRQRCRNRITVYGSALRPYLGILPDSGDMYTSDSFCLWHYSSYPD